MDSLTAAAQDVIARGMPLTTAARKHGVPRTTLRWRMAAMERELAGHALIFFAIGAGPSPRDSGAENRTTSKMKRAKDGKLKSANGCGNTRRAYAD